MPHAPTSLLILALALTCSSCGEAEETGDESSTSATSPIPTAPSEEPEITLTEIGAGTEGHDGWVQAKSSTAGFSVLLPGKYNDFQQSATSEKGNPLTTHHVGMVTPAGIRYSVTAFEGGDPRPPGGVVSSIVARSEKNSILENKVEFELDGSTGLQYDLVTSRSRATVRAIEYEGLIYLVVAEVPPELASREASNIARFLTSFRPKQRSESADDRAAGKSQSEVPP
jgi:hypothetical protein